MTDSWFPDSDPCWLGRAFSWRVDAPRDGLCGTIRRDAALVTGEAEGVATFVLDPDRHDLGEAGFDITHTPPDVRCVAQTDRGLLYGFLRLLTVPTTSGVSVPAFGVRMLDHWDNMTDGPMGRVERGYAGDSIFFDGEDEVRPDLGRVRDYARLCASVGIDAVSINNVNVHAVEATLLTERLSDVARVAGVPGEYGISTYLSVSFASPVRLGALSTADPLDEEVRRWWRQAAARAAAAIPHFGGFVVKADSEGQPGPFTYGRTHADGANMLAEALEPVGGTVFWRCFVYNHRQDWRDRSTDRARAAYDHFLPLDGTFAENVVLQVKNGPMDFQVREPTSPLFFAATRTPMACEVQITQEYTGQQRHAVHLGPMWAETLAFPSAITDTVPALRALPHLRGLVGVANVGTDWSWCGHPFAHSNWYAFGRLAWDPALAAGDILREWAGASYGGGLAPSIVRILEHSLATYEGHSAPLGVGFMVNPGHHYGPNVDGYEYSPWGTYHFADRDGIGVDRTSATGTGYAAQYPEPVAAVYDDLATCPDELLLFFHHVPYKHTLHSGATVAQHIYDTHFAAVEEVEQVAAVWSGIRLRVEPRRRDEIDRRMTEQRRSAVDWRDQINTYVFRHSGIPDARGRRIY